MHMCAADFCVAAGLQTFSAGRTRLEFQWRWKRPRPTNHSQTENRAFLNVCTATDAIRGSKKQWEQKAKIYVSQTITVT